MRNKGTCSSGDRRLGPAAPEFWAIFASPQVIAPLTKPASQTRFPATVGLWPADHAAVVAGVFVGSG
jgi:hypothetical protein